MRCAIHGCGDEGTLYPIIMLRVRGHEDRPGQAIVGFMVCPGHAVLLHVDDLLTNEAWQHICEGLRLRGKQRPCRDLVTLEYASSGDLSQILPSADGRVS
jgi:hypothetical protein